MKLGILGTGKIVQEALPVLKSLPQIECVALCSTPRSKEKMEELCSAYQIPKGYTNYSSFLQENDATLMDTVYIAVPNKLHYEMAVQALESGKHVIVEKPMTCSLEETDKLIKLAQEKNLFLFEAITTRYLKNYHKIKDLLPTLGKIKIVQCNFSQYSSRYDDFLEKKVAPVFDPKQKGGALMDINLYNIHYVAGLFGQPEEIIYRENKELPGGVNVNKIKNYLEADQSISDDQAIDVSGVVTLVYPEFIAVCIAAKDCGAPAEIRIQGTKGYLLQNTPPNICGEIKVTANDGTTQIFSEEENEHRMVAEFIAFEKMIKERQISECYDMLEQSKIVSSILSQCKR